MPTSRSSPWRWILIRMEKSTSTNFSVSSRPLSGESDYRSRSRPLFSCRKFPHRQRQEATGCHSAKGRVDSSDERQAIRHEWSLLVTLNLTSCRTNRLHSTSSFDCTQMTTKPIRALSTSLLSLYMLLFSFPLAHFHLLNEHTQADRISLPCTIAVDLHSTTTTTTEMSIDSEAFD